MRLWTALRASVQAGQVIYTTAEIGSKVPPPFSSGPESAFNMDRLPDVLSLAKTHRGTSNCVQRPSNESESESTFLHSVPRGQSTPVQNMERRDPLTVDQRT